MSFNNFKILAEKLPQLAEIATFSENYVYTDPQSSIAKSRLFIEKLTKILYKAYKIEIDSSQSLVDWLSNPDFKAVVPNVILYKIHSIRKSANIVVHGGTVSSNNALSVLLELYEISKWCAAVLLGIKPSDYPDFVSPKPQRELEDKTVSLLESVFTTKVFFPFLVNL